MFNNNRMDNIYFKFSNIIYGEKTVRQQMDEIMGDAHTAGTQVIIVTCFAKGYDNLKTK